MCIVIVSTIHPTYPFILLSNRDEYLARPTARATWWQPPNSHVLGGYDLHRSVHGTWLGITRQGRLAVLTNFREQGSTDAPIEGARSRGEIPKAFLTTPPASGEGLEEFARRLVERDGVGGVGGFSAAFGRLGRGVGGGGLALISNRTPDGEGVRYEQPETWGLSNSNYGDRAWPKVVDGERLLDRAIKESVFGRETGDQLVERCFDILSTDTLPRRKPGQGWEVFVKELRHSIFIPLIGGDDEHASKRDGGAPADEIAAAEEETPVVSVTSGKYGTQQQTVILVDREGKCRFVERTLYDDQDGKPMSKGERDREFEFEIEGWD